MSDGPLVRAGTRVVCCGVRVVRSMKMLPALLMVCAVTPAFAQELPRVTRGDRTRSLMFGAGHSWRPIFGQTTSEVTFGAFHPRIGWTVADRLDLFGEATLFVYDTPSAAVAAGAIGIAGRYYLTSRARWLPYANAGAGLLWTSLDVPEIDRVFNFQLFMGVGLRQNRPQGPCLVIEFRNHHISNAGTAGENRGINAATLITGVEWVLRR
jgi:lipid A 3-O-deacylase